MQKSRDTKQPPISVILREINCLGHVGPDAVAQSFDKRFPANAAACKTEFDRGLIEPGRVFVFDRGVGESPRLIFNLPTKIHFKAPTTLGVLHDGISAAVELCLTHHVDALEIQKFALSDQSITWQCVKIEFLTSFARVPEIGLRFVADVTDSTPQKQVTVFTDGGAEPNPGVGGYGIVLRFGNAEKELSQGFELTTNNRMELLAATVALESVKVSCNVRLYSDSKYVVDSVNTGVVFRWRAKNWKEGKIKNHDLWERFVIAYSCHNVEMVWVKGHSGIEGNERCDALATAAIATPNREVDQGYLDWIAANPRKSKKSKSKMTAKQARLGLPNKVGEKEPAVKQSVAAAPTSKRGPKPKKIGDPCRNCATPLVRRETKKSNPNSKYYFTWHLHCRNCDRLFHVDQAKVYR